MKSNTITAYALFIAMTHTSSCVVLADSPLPTLDEIVRANASHVSSFAARFVVITIAGDVSSEDILGEAAKYSGAGQQSDELVRRVYDLLGIDMEIISAGIQCKYYEIQYDLVKESMAVRWAILPHELCDSYRAGVLPSAPSPANMSLYDGERTVLAELVEVDDEQLYNIVIYPPEPLAVPKVWRYGQLAEYINPTMLSNSDYSIESDAEKVVITVADKSHQDSGGIRQKMEVVVDPRRGYAVMAVAYHLGDALFKSDRFYDYKQVESGCWYPHRSESAQYIQINGQDRALVTHLTIAYEGTVQFNILIEDAAFVIDMPDGSIVTDLRQ